MSFLLLVERRASEPAADCGLILAKDMTLDGTSLKALMLTVFLIFTTIHAQDFADCEGDKESGRRTLPIVYPEASRVYIMLTITVWSILLCAIWDIGTVASLLITATGTFVGWRYFDKRAITDDEKSYLLYNVSSLCRRILSSTHRCTVVVGLG